MTIAREIEVLCRASYAGIALKTSQELLALRTILGIVQGIRTQGEDGEEAAYQNVYRWTAVRGVQQVSLTDEGVTLKGDVGGTNGLGDACTWALENVDRSVVIFCDAQTWSLEQDPGLSRLIRELLLVAPSMRSVLFFLGDSWTGHPSFNDEVYALDYGLPSLDELREIVQSTAGQNGIDLKNEACEEIVGASRGMTRSQIEVALTRSWVETKALTPKAVFDAKIQAVKSASLEIIAPVPIEEIGGLDVLKDYMRKRTNAFGRSAQEYGLPSPKGILLIGGPGCLHGSTEIFDPIDGSTLPVAERWASGLPFHVWSMSNNGPVVTKAMPPAIYPKSDMVRVELEDGRHIIVTPDHQFWAGGNRWIRASSVSEQLREYEPVLLPTTSDSDLSGRLASARRSMHRARGSLAYCRTYLRSRDGQLPLETSACRSSAPSRSYARERNRGYSRRRGLACGLGYIRSCRRPFLRSRLYSLTLRSRLDETCYRSTISRQRHEAQMSHARVLREAPLLYWISCFRTGIVPRPCRPAIRSTPEVELRKPSTRSIRSWSSTQARILSPCISCQTGASPVSSRARTSACLAQTPPVRVSDNHTRWVRQIRVVRVEKIDAQPYFDFHVPVFNNYWAHGMWHHNTGKSLCAKAAGSVLCVPVIRMDIAAQQGSLVGETQANLERDLRIVEAMDRCLLFLDEIDKALSGVGNGPGGDSGVSSKQFGRLLTWMQERKSRAYVIASANDVSGLPPELLRKGRFDEIFFVDYPSTSECEAIVQIKLNKYVRGRAHWGKPYRIATLARTSAQRPLTGAEIEQAIINAVYEAFDDGERPVSDTDLQKSFETIIPLTETMGEKIKALRAWCEKRAVRASSVEKPKSSVGRKALN